MVLSGRIEIDDNLVYRLVEILKIEIKWREMVGEISRKAFETWQHIESDDSGVYHALSLDSKCRYEENVLNCRCGPACLLCMHQLRVWRTRRSVREG